MTTKARFNSNITITPVLCETTLRKNLSVNLKWSCKLGELYFSTNSVNFFKLKINLKLKVTNLYTFNI